ncbi:MAG TPA: hypothetical protein VFI02_17680 [Armatimonadota bacterium]|nr:hypothetical protein [Armatimonadota bacterium]
MLAIPHMAAGAAIARRVRPGWLALSLAFLSHFLLDMIPHIGTHKFLDPTADRHTVSESIFALLDFFIGAALVAWAALGRSDKRMVFAGGFLGIPVAYASNLVLLPVSYSSVILSLEDDIIAGSGHAI